MSMAELLSIRQAQTKDTSDLAFFLNQARYVHRHLDWRSTLEWLGEAEFWMLERDGMTQAAFACPPDPLAVAWVRLFASGAHINPDTAWEHLLNHAVQQPGLKPPVTLAAISLHDWFERLLLRHGWQVHQHIVTLSWNGALPPNVKLLPDAVIRPILPEDIPSVTRIDNLAFEPLWQLSELSLKQAFEQSAFATLMEIRGQIVAYQISTASSFNAHLARLAVQPELQGKSIGYALVLDLLKHLERLNIWSVTVNTQHDNASSQALYRRLGFSLTGDQFPVLVYPR